MSFHELSIEDRISRSSNIFNNVALNSELSALLAKRGLTDSKMGQGSALLDSAKTAIEVQAKEYSEKFAVNAELNETREQLTEQCDDLFTISRIALEEQ